MLALFVLLVARRASAQAHVARSVSIDAAAGLAGGVCYDHCGASGVALELTSLVAPNRHFAVGVTAARSWFKADDAGRDGSFELLAGVLRYTSLPPRFVLRPYLQFGAGLGIAGAAAAGRRASDAFVAGPALDGAGGLDLMLARGLHVELQAAGTVAALPQPDPEAPPARGGSYVPSREGPPLYGGWRATLGLSGVLSD